MRENLRERRKPNGTSAQSGSDAAADNELLGNFKLPDGDLPAGYAAADAQCVSLCHSLSGAGLCFPQEFAPCEPRDREVQYHGRTVACHRVYEPYLRCALYLRFQRGLHRRAFRGDDTDPGVHRLPQKAGEEVRCFDAALSCRPCADDTERNAQACVRRYHLPVRSGVLLRRPDGHGKGRGE